MGTGKRKAVDLRLEDTTVSWLNFWECEVRCQDFALVQIGLNGVRSSQ
jgi:hypothetical protein